MIGVSAIVLVNDELQADVMHSQRTTERAGPAHQHAATLTQGTVNGFHNAGLPAAFGTGLVGALGQHALVGLPLIGVVPGVGAIGLRQRLPQALRGGLPATAQHPRHNPTSAALNSQPQPYLAAFLTHKRPHFVEFQLFHT